MWGPFKHLSLYWVKMSQFMFKHQKIHIFFVLILLWKIKVNLTICKKNWLTQELLLLLSLTLDLVWSLYFEIFRLHGCVLLYIFSVNVFTSKELTTYWDFFWQQGYNTKHIKLCSNKNAINLLNIKACNWLECWKRFIKIFKNSRPHNNFASSCTLNWK